MKIRVALLTDIPSIQLVRNSVKENRLSDPSLVPDKDVADYITRKGRGWVCEMDDRIIGFAIASVVDNNVWALFVEPGYEAMGAGRRLHEEMMNWYFEQTDKPIWLGTAPGTRAESFYRKAGWKETGLHGKNELKFEMSAGDWINRNR